MSTETTFTFADEDGFEVHAYRWAPSSAPRAVVQIAHGAVEHAGRYRRAAEHLNRAGYVVYADDHRGHGLTAGTSERAGKTGDDGWNGIVRDIAQLTGIARDEHHGLPIFLLGHSLGSIAAQQYAEQHGAGLAGVILSGSWGALPGLEDTIVALEAEAAEGGRDAPSMVFLAMFGAFNERFEATTGFEWLSRDAEEVQRYVDDPWCGSFAYSTGLALDFFLGMRDIWNPDNEAAIPRSLPILALGGDQDPAGGYSETARLLVNRYIAGGLEDVTVRFYPGARHEILNETNRDEVHADVVAWLDWKMQAATAAR